MTEDFLLLPNVVMPQSKTEGKAVEKSDGKKPTEKSTGLQQPATKNTRGKSKPTAKSKPSQDSVSKQQSKTSGKAQDNSKPAKTAKQTDDPTPILPSQTDKKAREEGKSNNSTEQSKLPQDSRDPKPLKSKMQRKDPASTTTARTSDTFTMDDSETAAWNVRNIL